MDSKRQIKQFTLLFIMIVLCMFAVGCYETSKEIISVYEAVTISGLPSKQGDYTLTVVPNSKDYRFIENLPEGASAGYARLMPLRENIYIVQLKYDKQPNYLFMFVKLINDINGQSIEQVFPKEYIDSSRYRVKSDTTGLIYTRLTGRREDIMNFFKAYAAADFSE